MMTLGEFLRRPQPHDWNCSTEAGDWCVSLGHADFVAPWRGLTDPTACSVASEGILLSLWETGIGDGIPVAHPPYKMGDIAVVTIKGDEKGAIFTGDKWALRHDNRRHFLSPSSVKVLKVWRP